MMTKQSTYSENLLTAYLVSGVRLGDAQAAHDLVVQRGPRLMAHAVRLLGERDAAQDVVQDAWVDIFRGLHGLRDDHAFLPWALSIVSRKVARLIAKRQHDRKLSSAVVDLAEPPADVVTGETAVEAARVRRALQTLSPDHRATIALFYLEDMGVADVAKALDVPVGTVKSRLMHAREKLKHILEGDQDGQDG